MLILYFFATSGRLFNSLLVQGDWSDKTVLLPICYQKPSPLSKCIYMRERFIVGEKCTRVRINWWITLEINCSQRKELFVDIDLSVSVILRTGF